MQIRLNALNSKAFTKKTFILKIERFQADPPPHIPFASHVVMNEDSFSLLN